MIKVEKYTGTKTYMFPSGKIATPDVVKETYPAMLTFTHIIETDEAGQVMYAIENLSAARSRLGIDPSLSEDEAIAKIEEERNKKPEYFPSTEERIAAALEYKNLESI